MQTFLFHLKEKQFSFDSFIRGWHAYMEIWIPKPSLFLKCEDGNEHSKYAVAVMVGGQTGGHVPKSLNKLLKTFLTSPNCVIKCKVVGNRGGRYGLEIPVQYKYFGP